MPLSESLRADLEDRVRRDRVVLFMKGDRRAPQCGFSASVVAILDELGSAYETVNVLASAELRDGVKEFSEWPTFPQLYVDGKLVGGADIVRELHASGELARLLGASPEPPAAPRVTLTEAAMRALVRVTGDVGDVLHLAVDGRFQHELYLGPKEPSELEVVASGVTLAVPAACAKKLDGVSIDFVDAPQGGAFKIDNPNEPPRVRSMTAPELSGLLARGAPLHLFDVRTDEERRIASIAAATPWTDRARDALEDLDRDATLVFQCHHGMRSRAAAEHAVRMGFRNVYNLEGGIDAWSTTVDPSVPRY